MAVGTWKTFNDTRLWMADATNLSDPANSFYLALMTSAWTPNAATQSLWADVSGNEIAAGNGYTAGGVALTGVTVTKSTSTVTFSYTGPTPKWTASGGSIPVWRYGLIYVNATINGHIKPLAFYFLGDDTPADVPATSAGVSLDIPANASGVFDLTGMA